MGEDTRVLFYSPWLPRIHCMLCSLTTAVYSASISPSELVHANHSTPGPLLTTLNCALKLPRDLGNSPPCHNFAVSLTSSSMISMASQSSSRSIIRCLTTGSHQFTLRPEVREGHDRVCCGLPACGYPQSADQSSL